MFNVNDPYWDAERTTYEDELDFLRRKYEAERIERERPFVPSKPEEDPVR